MTPAETIAAAIEKLEQQKADSTPGPWDFEYSDESIEVNAGTARTRWNEGHTSGIPASSWKTTDRILDVDVYDIEEDEADLIAGNAELIVVLHRTIDPDLKLLRAGLNVAEFIEARQEPFLQSDVLDLALDLAHAILGEARS